MRTLAIECATEACSVALLDGDEVLSAAHEVLGRGHAEHLVPMIARLPGMGRADRILVSLGPGSFTGTRIGIATARALAIAWQARVEGYPTLALVAAQALRMHEGSAVGVAMSGGHGEWFVEEFGSDGLPLAAHASLSPAEASAAIGADVVAGSQAEALVALRGWGTPLSLLPDARFAGALDPRLFTGRVSPLYGRGPDARLPA
ncbi:MAG: tRNA (adenosine(37)-N6)-threonylcarbamoyltransferase complex dimerization subunit type 1 TsaB [Tsuneonella sp.]